MNENKTRTIDITPTWRAIMPTMVAVLTNPKASSDSHKIIADELMRLAKLVDDQNAKAKAEHEWK
jgi:hypothetical protein